MQLSDGERLGPYLVVGPIDSGGMAEVYRGRDTRLDREVAIKILPEAFASDPERLRWFERECKTLAAISHPNIVAIFDVGSKGSLHYLVTELLHGHTLRERLRKGALSHRDVLEYGSKIAEGLAAAHSKNLVHCDLKPENIFLTSDGQLKILDFGLAKTAELHGEVSTTAATATAQVVVGTTSYMSPEHVLGKPLDARSDIFSLGSTLYEMLFGEMAFRKTTQVETMNAVLNAEPRRLFAPEAQVGSSHGCVQIIRRCVEKDPQRRFQCASDLAFSLQKLADIPPSPNVRRKPLMWATAALIFVAFAIALGFRYWFVNRPQTPKFRQLIFGRGYISSARFTPDGESVVYGAAFVGRPREMYLTRLDGQSSRHMGLPSGDVLGISQHGEMAILLDPVNFYNWMVRGTLGIAPLSGGAAHTLFNEICDSDIAPSGKTLAIVRCVDSTETLEFPVGKVLVRTSGWISVPRISPDGQSIAFLEHPLLGDDRGYVSLVDMTGKAKRLTQEWAGEDGLAWSVDGQEIWFSSTWGAEPEALRAVTLSGRQRLILASLTDISLRDVSRTGSVLLTSVRDSTDVGIGYKDGQPGHSIDVADENAGINGISYDGKAAAMVYSGTAGGRDYKTYGVRRDSPDPILLGDGDPTSISPDGKWILSILPSSPSKALIYPTEAGEARIIDLGPIVMVTGVTSWSADGKIAFTGAENGQSRVYLLDPASGSTTPITRDGESDPLISPDGKRVLVRDRSRTFAIYDLSANGPIEVKTLTRKDIPIQWDNSGERLFVWDGLLPAKIFRVDVRTGNREHWLDVSPADPSGLLYGHVYVSPDGQSYAYHFRRVLSNLFVAEGLR